MIIERLSIFYKNKHGIISILSIGLQLQRKIYLIRLSIVIKLVEALFASFISNVAELIIVFSSVEKFISSIPIPWSAGLFVSLIIVMNFSEKPAFFKTVSNVFIFFEELMEY